MDLVKMAHSSGRKLRVLASGHSWSEIAQTEDIMVSTMNYSGLVGVDKARMLVTVKAGTKLSDLNSLLDAEGLAMTTMPTITDQSIAGAISTGTYIMHTRLTGTYIMHTRPTGTYIMHTRPTGTYIMHTRPTGTYIMHTGPTGTYIMHARPYLQLAMDTAEGVTVY